MSRKRIPDIEILKLIENKLSITEMAFKLGVTKGAVSQRIKKLQNKGLIELDIEETSIRRTLTLSDVKIFRLTEKGKREVYKLLAGGEVEIPHVRGVHNVQFKFKIRKKGDLWFDHKVVLKNWVKKYTWFGDIFVEQNGKEEKPSSLVIKFGLEEPNPWKAAYKALETALKMKKIFEDMVGFELGDPEMIGKPKWEIQGDPVAKKISKKQVVVTEHGAIDNTPEQGTLHLYDVEDVETYIRMAREIREMKQDVKDAKDEFWMFQRRIPDMLKSFAVEIGKEIAHALTHPERATSTTNQNKQSEERDWVIEGYG